MEQLKSITGQAFTFLFLFLESISWPMLWSCESTLGKIWIIISILLLFFIALVLWCGCDLQLQKVLPWKFKFDVLILYCDQCQSSLQCPINAGKLTKIPIGTWTNLSTNIELDLFFLYQASQPSSIFHMLYVRFSFGLLPICVPMRPC